MKNRLLLVLLTGCALQAQAPVPTAGNVALPIEEYNRLSDLARKPTAQPARPPMNYVLKAADLRLQIEHQYKSYSKLFDLDFEPG